AAAASRAAPLSACDDRLRRVEIEGGTEGELRAFTTALYHVLLQPSVASDTDGKFMGFDGKVATATDHVRYADFSGWDIYRSWIQLVSVLAPDETKDM